MAHGSFWGALRRLAHATDEPPDPKGSYHAAFRQADWLLRADGKRPILGTQPHIGGETRMLAQIASLVLPLVALFLFIVLVVRFAIPRNRKS